MKFSLLTLLFSTHQLAFGGSKSQTRSLRVADSELVAPIATKIQASHQIEFDQVITEGFSLGELHAIMENPLLTEDLVVKEALGAYLKKRSLNGAVINEGSQMPRQWSGTITQERVKALKNTLDHFSNLDIWAAPQEFSRSMFDSGRLRGPLTQDDFDPMPRPNGWESFFTINKIENFERLRGGSVLIQVLPRDGGETPYDSNELRTLKMALFCVFPGVPQTAAGVKGIVLPRADRFAEATERYIGLRPAYPTHRDESKWRASSVSDKQYVRFLGDSLLPMFGSHDLFHWLELIRGAPSTRWIPDAAQTLQRLGRVRAVSTVLGKDATQYLATAVAGPLHYAVSDPSRLSPAEFVAEFKTYLGSVFYYNDAARTLWYWLNHPEPQHEASRAAAAKALRKWNTPVSLEVLETFFRPAVRAQSR